MKACISGVLLFPLALPAAPDAGDSCAAIFPIEPMKRYPPPIVIAVEKDSPEVE
jgi:hypothetical protein